MTPQILNMHPTKCTAWASSNDKQTPIQSPLDFTWINAMVYFYDFALHIGGHFAALGSNWYSSTIQFPCYQGLYMNPCICPDIFH